MTQKEFIKKYNSICDKHLKLNSTLKELSDDELYIWIAGQTVHSGRSLKDSFRNAKIHMKNRAKAERLFSIKHNDLLGAC